MRRLGLAVILLVVAACWGQGNEKPSPSPEGFWTGTLKVGLIELRLVFRLEKMDDGWKGTMESIDQGGGPIPLTLIDIKGDAVRLEIKPIGGLFEGKRSDTGKMTGRWKQSGNTFSLTLLRTDQPPQLVRPQHPKPPYPYATEDVVVHNKPAKITLAGTLTLPKGAGPFPAVLLWSGSGPQDRDETLLGHKPFLVIADHLTRQGVAVLRMDDRGVGGSTGNVMDMTIADQAQDAQLCIDLLKSRREIDRARIGFIGHSEGGYVAPLLAASSKDVAFIVMLAGPGLSGEEILILQGVVILKSLGLQGDALKKQRELQEMLFNVVKSEPDNDKVQQLVRERLKEMQEKAIPLEQIQWLLLHKIIEGQLKTITTPWFRYFLTFDPRPSLSKLKVPVLVIIGEKDLQVPPRENFKALEKVFRDSGHPDFTLKEMPGLNHLFQTAKTGALAEYGRIEETFAPAALDLLTEWIMKRARVTPPTKK